MLNRSGWDFYIPTPVPPYTPALANNIPKIFFHVILITSSFYFLPRVANSALLKSGSRLGAWKTARTIVSPSRCRSRGCYRPEISSWSRRERPLSFCTHLYSPRYTPITRLAFPTGFFKINKPNLRVNRAWVETPGARISFFVSGPPFTPYQEL